MQGRSATEGRRSTGRGTVGAANRRLALGHTKEERNNLKPSSLTNETHPEQLEPISKPEGEPGHRHDAHSSPDAGAQHWPVDHAVSLIDHGRQHHDERRHDEHQANALPHTRVGGGMEDVEPWSVCRGTSNGYNFLRVPGRHRVRGYGESKSPPPPPRPVTACKYQRTLACTHAPSCECPLKTR
jgi:hypothetical protein